MSEILLRGVVTSESQFRDGLHNACGFEAIRVGAAWSSQNAGITLLDLFKKARSLGKGQPDGTATPDDLERTLTSLGYTLTYKPSNQSLLGFVTRMAGTNAVIFEGTNCQALRDEITGATEDATNLHNHYICIVGRNSGGYSPRAGRNLPSGYWAADGCNNIQNPIVNGVRNHRDPNSDLVFYSDSTIENALPYMAFAIMPRILAPALEVSTMIDITTANVTRYFKANGTSWQRLTGVDPVSKQPILISGNILTFYKGYGNSANCGLTYLGLPLANPMPTGKPGATFQPFERGTLVEDPKHVFDGPPGAGSVYLAHIESGICRDWYAASALAPLKIANATLQSTIQSVKALVS